MVRRSRWLFCIPLVALLMTRACDRSPRQTSKGAIASITAKVEQDFTVAVGSEIGDLNPHNYKSSFPALDLIYEPLIRYAPSGTLLPGLAKSREISEDGKTWTFQIREGVTFHDGTPFDAIAAKWNLARWVGGKDREWLPGATM